MAQQQKSKRVVPRGLEPRTLRLLAVRSNQLSYETHVLCRLDSWRSGLVDSNSEGELMKARVEAILGEIFRGGYPWACWHRRALSYSSACDSPAAQQHIFVRSAVASPAALAPPLPLPCPKNAKLLLQPRRLGAATWHF